MGATVRLPLMDARNVLSIEAMLGAPDTGLSRREAAARALHQLTNEDDLELNGAWFDAGLRNMLFSLQARRGQRDSLPDDVERKERSRVVRAVDDLQSTLKTIFRV